MNSSDSTAKPSGNSSRCRKRWSPWLKTLQNAKPWTSFVVNTLRERDQVIGAAKNMRPRKPIATRKLDGAGGWQILVLKRRP